MSWLTKLANAPDINLNKLARGDKAERDKAAPVVADLIAKALPLLDSQAEAWLDKLVARLPANLIRAIRNACIRAVGMGP